MKKAILLYNPYAGSSQITGYLDYITERLQSLGYALRLYRSIGRGSIEKHLKEHVTEENTDLVLISGGDGTLNEAINGLCSNQQPIPIAILPFGTANDFAYSANIPTHLEGVMDVIAYGQPCYVDIGQVNDRYFINVCNMGIFSGISHIVDQDLKKKFGKLAYYVKGFEELQHYRLMELDLCIDGIVTSGEYLMLLVFNGKAAGGFTKLALNANIQDGEFDVIGIRHTEIHDIPRLFLKILQGEHLQDAKIDYYTAKEIKIACKNVDKQFITDVDGEKGPDFPLDIQLKKNKIQIYLM